MMENVMEKLFGNVDNDCSMWNNSDMVSNNNRGLGKGLGALISMFDEAGEANGAVPKHIVRNKEADGVTEIDISLIDNNLNQPRKSFNTEKLQELEASIRANGVIQPILVNKIGTRYMIVAGERRWRASKNIGLATIPAIVREYSNKQIAEIALVENLMRTDLNEIEIASGIKKLMETHLMTQEQVSAVLGLSRSAIANLLRFLNLPKEVQILLEHGKISAGHAKILCGVQNEALCISLANKCSFGMTVRDLTAAIANGKPGAAPAARPQSLELKQFALTLTQEFGTKVTIQGTDAKGKIIIEYYTKKDLERISKKLPF